MQDAVNGQDLHRLMPGGMHRCVFGRGHGKEFGQFKRESHGDVGVFRYDAAVLDGQQRKLLFQFAFLTDISHDVGSFVVTARTERIRRTGRRESR